MENKRRDFEDLKKVVATLRGDNGCPWDKEQNIKTIKGYLLEETHEIIQAIDNDDYENLKEELGDVMFQILFLARCAEEEGRFDIYDSITSAYDKFIRRHPHVFSEESGDSIDSAQVLELWEDIKKTEKKGDSRDILSDIPITLPALLRAFKVSKRAEKVGFDWEKKSDVIDKIEEEIGELRAAKVTKDTDNIEEELGDVLFSIVNLCRFLKVNPEIALGKTTNKFIKRFKHVQERVDYDFTDKEISELESYWEEAKNI